ncbi:cupin domain-containing protein [Hansschlegelia sp.]|uniref:cupin domain-containing protein n=1 Tax=Hansschlegelia sp. TaxID=2041892 RepID=UPI002B6762D5|nr:cupin domain-containing protein [Hansschlegelia sp.]HVI29778.1 cupin domain-containing protein [Hansschlegelia sp.]
MSALDGLSADEVVRLLDLKPHPEGGHFRETFRDPATDADGRSRSTAIYFLLAAGERSAWHRVDAIEIWHFYAGDALALSLSADGGATQVARLGPDVIAGEAPQLVVPTGWWQAAEPLGRWTLVGCTVAPGFDFAGFELAPPEWRPSGG